MASSPAQTTSTCSSGENRLDPAQIRLSPYASSLTGAARERHLAKIHMVDDYDCFLGVPPEASSVVPAVDACDLLSYLVLETSFVTAQQFTARKGLEAYNQFVCGWVKEVKSFLLNGKHVSLGRVRHSQKFSETPLSCWVITKKDGAVCCAHCNCMAGLGETCTHVAALLFYLEALARAEDRKTCTEELCQWKMPAFQRSMEYAAIKDIDFTSAKRKKVLAEACVSTSTVSSTDSQHQQSEDVEVRQPTADEKKYFFKKLKKAGARPAILSLVPPYSKEYVPKESSGKLLVPLPSLYQEAFQKLSWEQLMQCQKLELKVTEQQASAMEAETKSQAKSRIWFSQRAGRITASQVHDVCRASVDNPSASLIKKICYPETFVFTTPATDWGSRHEQTAGELYCKHVGPDHTGFSVVDSGFIINTAHPHIGASPDGIISCQCCSQGVLEIKCPFAHRGESLQSAVSDRKFCLQNDGDGKLQLKRDHKFYYQVQTQIFTCELEYCDFVDCTFSSEGGGFFVERILKDESLWQKCLVSGNIFFRKCLLPELMGKWFTSSSSRLSRPPTTTASLSSALVLPSSPAPSSDVIPAVFPQTTSAILRTLMSSPDFSTGQSPSWQGSRSSVSNQPILSCRAVSRCKFCSDANPVLVICVCRRCSVEYHHMCQTKDDEGKLCDQCFCIASA